jgi:hypothetical protein
MSALLDHLERTLADNYRKEIDQEENTWRALPFFAAALALQLAAIFALLQRLPPLEGWERPAVIGLAAVVACATLTALALVAACIAPARFTYAASEPDLVDFVLQLQGSAAQEPTSDPAVQRDQAEDAMFVLKRRLARQYAAAMLNNRRINQRRLLLRSIAGLVALLSIAATLALVGVGLWVSVIAAGA